VFGIRDLDWRVKAEGCKLWGKGIRVYGLRFKDLRVYNIKVYNIQPWEPGIVFGNKGTGLGLGVCVCSS